MKRKIAVALLASLALGAGPAAAVDTHSDGGEYRTGNTPRSTWWSASAVSFTQPSGKGKWLFAIHLQKKQRLAPGKGNLIVEFRDSSDKYLCRRVVKNSDYMPLQTCAHPANRPIEYVAFSVDVNNDGTARRTWYLRP